MSLFRDAIARSANTGIFAPALLRSPPRRVPDVGVDPFFNIDGGVARYDARTLQLTYGAPIDAWEDMSGQVANAICTSPGNCPTYQTGERPGVAFVTTNNNYLYLPSDLRFNLSASWTVVVLMERQARNPYQILLSLGQTASTQEWQLSAAASNNVGTAYGGAFAQGSADSWPNDLTVVSRRVNGTRAEVYLGEDLALSRARGNTVSEPDALVSIGALVGVTGGASNGLTGLVHDLIFWERELTLEELASVRAGLSQDWGI